MIRLATLEDMPALLRMGKSFFDASGYGGLTTFDHDDTSDLLSRLIDAETLVTDGKGAMLGFVVFPMFMNSSTVVAQELFWWVDKAFRKTGVGVEILKHAEDLARMKGAKSMMMLSLKELDGERVNKLYQRMGYQEREQTYMRIL